MWPLMKGMEHKVMTKVFKWLGGAVAGIALFGAVGVMGASEVAAESPPAPPAKFAGSVTVDGQPAAPGTVIQARIGSASCGVDTVFMSGAEARYTIEVPALDPGANPNCGTEGGSVTFWVGDQMAKETGSWLNYQLNILNLTVVSATETPTETTTPTTPTTPGTPNTPVPPATGSGVTGNSAGASATWLFAAVALGAVAFGAAGVAAARRS